ncbi:MAG TPA: enoyl-CoA hydratase-related protein, partial [Terriglobia bacterium]|nr:enoyl-CoA hydratase-related protein [Terriglobia bacterium]
MSYETLLFETRAGIAYVTINRPQKLNALNHKAIHELTDCFDRIARTPEVLGVILTGAGEKAFAAGADISELAALTPTAAREKALEGQALMNRIESLGKPVVAAVNGFALGGGCELAMACTFRIASESARFGQPEVRLGIIPGYAGTQRLPRLVGKGHALNLILSGEPIGAQEAWRIGLVNHVVSSTELIPASESLVQKILANGPVAVSYAIEAVNRGMEMAEAEGEQLEASLFGLCCATNDMKEGTRAFLEKR